MVRPASPHWCDDVIQNVHEVSSSFIDFPRRLTDVSLCIAGISNSDFQRLMRLGQWHRYNPADVVQDPAHPIDHFHIVLSG